MVVCHYRNAMRVIPVMLALLLALSPGVAATDVSPPNAAGSRSSNGIVGQAAEGNTTEVLGLGTEPDRTAFESPTVSLGSSIAMDRDEFRTRLDVTVLDKQLRTADTPKEQKQVLNRYRYRIENRIISLKATERRVSRSFSNGSLSTTEYARTLGRIDAAAEDLRTLIDAMENRTDDVPRFDLESEADTLRGKLVLLEGPIRDRIHRILTGEARSVRTFVATADTGVVLATIDGTTHVREIVRLDRHDPATTGQLSHLEAQNVVLDHYTWAATNMDTDGTSTYLYGATNLYSVSISHTHGDLTAYLDAGTGQIFKEVQYTQLSGSRSINPDPGVTNTSNNVTLRVNRTYPGGPLRVELANATGAPLDGQVTVDGESAGRTGDDGVVWTLGPTGGFYVTATHEFTTITVNATEHDAS